VAKDVAGILGYDQTSNMLKRLDDDEMTSLGSSEMEELSIFIDRQEFGYRDVAIINESGLYKCIFSSRKAEAEQFRRLKS